MKWESIVRILNENQGVLAPVLFLIGIFGSLGAYFFRKKRKPPTEHPSASSSVKLIGAFNRIEGTAINQGLTLDEERPQVAFDKDKRCFECILRKRSIPFKEGLYYEFEFDGKKFVLKADVLGKEIRKRYVDHTSQLKISTKDLIKLLKKFMLFHEGSSSISTSDNLCHHVAKQLSKTDISLRVKVSISDLLLIPFQLLSNIDFGVTNHLFEITLEQ